MKIIQHLNRLLLPVLLVCICVLFQNCNNGKKPVSSFCGIVVSDSDGAPLSEVLIEIGELSTRTNDSGKFILTVDTASRYVLNATKIGYGFVSKIYTGSDCAIEIMMNTAVADTIDVSEPGTVIALEDTIPPPPTSEPLSANITTISSPVDTIPFVYDSQGRLIGFGAPGEVAATYEAAAEFTQPQEGAAVEVPADALVESGELMTAGFFAQDKEKRNTIIGSISTVDLYSPDGMPGDYTIRYDDNTTGYMETFGAADVNFYRNGKVLQLKEGQYATLRIPVDQLAVKFFGKKLRETIPLFVYNKKTGEWERDKDKWTKKENVGELNKEKTAYIAKISHFSVYNMDEEFIEPGCTRLVNVNAGAGNIPTTYDIEVAVPPHINKFGFGAGCAITCAGGIDETGKNVHVIARMKKDKPIGVRIFDDLGNIKSTYVLHGGGNSTDVMLTPACDLASYCACATEIEISNALPSHMNPNGTTRCPIIAMKETTTPSAGVVVSWLYIPNVVPGTPPDYTNSVMDYFVEASSDGTTWTQVAGPFSTSDWHSSTFVANTALDPVATSPTTEVLIRVRKGQPNEGINTSTSPRCYINGAFADCTVSAVSCAP